MAKGNYRSMVGRQGFNKICAGHRAGIFLFATTPIGVYFFARASYLS
jgi:hypothetical protein